MKRSAVLENRSDDELLRDGQAGDEEAFLALYRRRYGAIFRFALHMSGNHETAEEVVQEVFLALLDTSIKYNTERGALEAFLIGMARNKVRRQMRNNRRPDVRPDVREDQITREYPSDSFSRESDLEALRKAILALPESYRAVTVLCDLEELSYADAAQRLGCAVGTIRSRLHRARAILEAKLRRRNQCPISTIR